MTKEGEGLIDGEIHIPCRRKDCNGTLIFEGIKDRFGYFKCCRCEMEFKHSYGNWKKVNDKPSA